MKNAHPGFGLALAFVLALAAVGSEAAQAQKKAAPARTGQLSGPHVLFAPGQADFSCGFAAVTPCPKYFTVQVWLIPNQPPSEGVDAGYAGCVAAFPYKSLILLADKPQADQSKLVWQLPPPPTNYEFQFAGNGIEVTPQDAIRLGDVSNLFKDGKPTSVTAAQVVWTVYADHYLSFYGNHQPNVQYRPKGGQWTTCVPLDPVITNYSN